MAKTQRKFLALRYSLSALFITGLVVTPSVHAEIDPHGGDAEIFVQGTHITDVYPATRVAGEKYQDHIKIKLHLAAKVWTLMGSPVYMCSGWWELQSVNVSYVSSRLGDIPQSIKDKVHIWDSKFRVTMVSDQGFGGRAKLICDAGVFGPPNKKEASFNSPGSVGWDKIFEYSDTDVFTSGSREKQAKEAMKAAKNTAKPYTLQSIEVLQLKADIGPVYDWINQQEAKAVANQSARVEQKKQRVPDSFDSLFDTVDRAKAVKQKQVQQKNFEQQVSRQQDSTNAERLKLSMQIKQRDCGDKPLPGNAQRSLRTFIDAQENRMAECLAAANLTPQKNPETNRWGYVDPQGNWRIPASFGYARPFYAGVAAAKEHDGDWGYINQLGQWEIQPIYKNAGNFDPQTKQAIIWGHGDASVGVIDRQGDQIIEAKWGAVEWTGQYYKVRSQLDRKLAFSRDEKTTRCGETVWEEVDYYQSVWTEGEVRTDGSWASSPQSKQSEPRAASSGGIVLCRN